MNCIPYWAKWVQSLIHGKVLFSRRNISKSFSLSSKYKLASHILMNLYIKLLNVYY